MRGVLIVSLVVALLIVGILVMKNMGVGNSGGGTETQVKKYTEKAKGAADMARERFKDIRKQVPKSE